jgi:ABC-type multidrug transport system ATPase subunit
MIGIEIQNVSFSYINQSIFSDVSAKFTSGEKIQLTGDNGAGKTTLLKLICSLLKPQTGQIRYLDDKFDHDSVSIRKIIGVSLDDSHLLRHFTVAENLRLYQKLYTSTTSFEKIASWLDRFKLQTHRETPIQYLSQGEQKKVSLIKSFLHNPEILILDEPTNSLDHESKAVLGDIIQSLDSKRLILVSTHDHEWAKNWATREIKVQGGKIS